MTLPQIREGIALIFRGVSVWDDVAYIGGKSEALRRNELARFYHWKTSQPVGSIELTIRQF